jgi:hypothetical protein
MKMWWRGRSFCARRLCGVGSRETCLLDMRRVVKFDDYYCRFEVDVFLCC